MISAYLATLQGVKIKYAKQQITWPKLVSEVMGQLGHHLMTPNFIFILLLALHLFTL